MDERLTAMKIKDSGTRRNFESGAVRDAEEGKGRFDLITPIALTRLARHYENGAVKYDARNWEKGIPLSTFMDSTLRHLNKYREGIRDEDHMAAALWNVAGFIHTEEMIKRGLLPEELNDLPCYLLLPKEEPATASEISGEKSSNAIHGDSYERWKTAMQAQQQHSFFGVPEWISPTIPAVGPITKKITAYLSHPIRGHDDGRPEEQRIKENCADAIKMGNKLMEKFPNLDLYIPAAHDRALQVALKQDALSIDDVLRIDCEILKQQGLLFLYIPDGHISQGMRVEKNFAVQHQISVLSFDGTNESIKNIEVFLRDYK